METFLFYPFLITKKNCMNRNIIIATAVTAGTFALAYFLKKRRNKQQNITPVPASHSRHLTNVFAKAKHSLETE